MQSKLISLLNFMLVMILKVSYFRGQILEKPVVICKKCHLSIKKFLKGKVLWLTKNQPFNFIPHKLMNSFLIEMCQHPYYKHNKIHKIFEMILFFFQNLLYYSWSSVNLIFLEPQITRSWLPTKEFLKNLKIHCHPWICIVKNHKIRLIYLVRLGEEDEVEHSQLQKKVQAIIWPLKLSKKESPTVTRRFS